MGLNGTNADQPMKGVSSQNQPPQAPAIPKEHVSRLTGIFEKITQSNAKNQNSDQEIEFKADREIPKKPAETSNKTQSLRTTSSTVSDVLPYPSHLPPPPKPPTQGQLEGSVQEEIPPRDKGKEKVDETSNETQSLPTSSSTAGDVLPYPSHLPAPPEPPTEGQEEGSVQQETPSKDKGKDKVDKQQSRTSLSREEKTKRLKKISQMSSESIKNFRNEMKSESVNEKQLSPQLPKEFWAPLFEEKDNVSLKTDEEAIEYKNYLIDSFSVFRNKMRNKIIDDLSVLSQKASDQDKDQITALQQELIDTLKTSETDLFSKNESEGLSPKEFANKILKSKGLTKKKYRKLVKEFANKLTNNEMTRLKNAASIGAIIQEGGHYHKESDNLAYYISESVLKQEKIKDSEKIIQFYMDVAKNLEEKGDLSNFSSVISGLNQQAVSRLTKKMPKLKYEFETYIEGKSTQLITKSKWQNLENIYSNEKFITPNYRMLTSNAETSRIQVEVLAGQPENISKTFTRPLQSLKERAENFSNLPTSIGPLRMPEVSNFNENQKDKKFYELSDALMPFPAGIPLIDE